MMGFQRSIGSLFVIVMIMGFLFGTSQAYKFYVGGRDGWVLNPYENYTNWAQRNRFQVNDTLIFKYKKGSNSVLVVNKEDYDSCNTKNPKVSLTDGDSTFIFGHSGPFYFISGHADNCNNGQKLIIVVMAVRPQPDHQSPSPADSGSAEPPQSHSGSEGFAGFMRLALAASFGVSLILG